MTKNLKLKHTPGPWELSDCGEHIIGQADQDEIIEVANLENTLHVKANAALIAAAPELLEALINLNRFLVTNVNPEAIRVAPKAHLAALKAIAKAEGNV